MYICSLDKTVHAHIPGIYMQKTTNKQTNSVFNTMNIIIFTHVYSIPLNIKLMNNDRHLLTCTSSMQSLWSYSCLNNFARQDVHTAEIKIKINDYKKEMKKFQN